MYLSYYELKEKPFSISTNPKFLWLGEKHKEAFSVLKYGVLDNKGFLLLTGDIGAGKTTLIHALTSGLANDVIWASVPDPGLGLLDFFRYIANEFKLDHTFSSKAEFLIMFRKFLLKSYKNKKKVLLIIDEAQRLNSDLLEEIRMLSNIELGTVKLMSIFFVGQIEFNAILVNERNRAVRQRITVSYHIKPLSEKETGMYIRHRLKVAGAKRNIFSFVAVNQIYMYSKGCPRVINIICDLAMLTGYSKEIKRIGIDIIDESIKNFEVETNPSGIDELPAKKRKLWGQINMPLLSFFVLFIVGNVLFFSNFYKSEVVTNFIADFISVSDTKNEVENKLEQFAGEMTSSVSVQQKHKITSEPETEVKINENKKVENREGEKGAVEPYKKNENKENIEENELPFGSEKTIIGFNHNSNEFPDDAYKKLDVIAEFMRKDPKVSVFITGYTDELGTYAYNVNLSIFRANIVKSYLVGKGVNKQRIKVSGLGSADPIATNATPIGRKLNRRVELEIFNFYRSSAEESGIEEEK